MKSTIITATRKKTSSQLSLSAHLSKYRAFKNRENEQGKASDTQSRTMYLLWQKRYLSIFISVKPQILALAGTKQNVRTTLSTRSKTET